MRAADAVHYDLIALANMHKISQIQIMVSADIYKNACKEDKIEP